MKLIDDLMTHAAQADQMMGQLAEEERGRLDRKKVYDGLQDEFDRMAADGYLDQDEVKQLMADFRAKGMDTASLQVLLDSLKSSDRVKASDVRYEVGEQIRKKKAELDDPDFNFKAQSLMSEYNEAVSTVASIQKSEHDKYMTAIRNMVA